jgi:hypothetical protein
MKDWIKKLYRLDSKPCAEAVKWAENYNTLQAAWDACPRGDWMGWMLDRLSAVDQKKKIKLCYMNARLALPYTTDPHARHAIEVIEAWDKGEATEKDVKAAVVEARVVWAAGTAAETAEWAAAWAAGVIAWAASWAAREASRAAARAVARGWSVRAVTEAAELRILQECADNARKIFPAIQL